MMTGLQACQHSLHLTRPCSHMTYSCELAQGSIPLDARMDKALQLFGLDTVEIMREKTHDTKMLLGSGPTAAVLAFRGTSSAAAAWADLQVRAQSEHFCQ